MNKKLLSIIVAGTFILPTVARAGGTIIGTDAYALAADGIGNAFFQGKIDRQSAFLLEVASDLGVSIFQGSYKAYLGGNYANAPYLAAGLLFASSGSSSVTGFTGKIGVDFPVGDAVVLSPYYGIISVSGYNGGGIGFNVGVKF